MPSNLVKTKRDERLWEMAKEIASKKKSKKNKWAYTTGTFERLKNREGGSRG